MDSSPPLMGRQIDNLGWKRELSCHAHQPPWVKLCVHFVGNMQKKCYMRSTLGAITIDIRKYLCAQHLVQSQLALKSIAATWEALAAPAPACPATGGHWSCCSDPPNWSHQQTPQARSFPHPARSSTTGIACFACLYGWMQPGPLTVTTDAYYQ